MTIQKKYKVNWFKNLSPLQLAEVLENGERYQDWNRLGFLCALVENRQLTVAETVVLRDRFKEKYGRYYRHRAFTHTEYIAFLEYLDVAYRPAIISFDDFGRRREHARMHEQNNSLFAANAQRLTNTQNVAWRSLQEADRFIEEAYHRGITKVRQGAFHARPQYRKRSVLTDPYFHLFGEVADNPFQAINAHQLQDKYTYNKRNGAKYESQKQPDYPLHTPMHRNTKNHKNLYQRLKNKRRRATGKQLVRDWEEDTMD